MKLDVEFFRYLCLIRVICYERLKQSSLQIRKKIVLSFVFREISSIVTTFYSAVLCCAVRESRTWIFLLCFSTNWDIWRIVRLSCKFQKFSDFPNSDFCVFLHESAHLLTLESILRIFKICRFVKPGFFLYFSTNWYIWQFLRIYSKFLKFENLGNLKFFVFLNELAHLAMFEATLKIFEICNNFQVNFREFFYFDFDQICAKITVSYDFAMKWPHSHVCILRIRGRNISGHIEDYCGISEYPVRISCVGAYETDNTQ